jgi:hypothetical protein
MNLTNMMRKDAAVEDHALVDHSWYQNGGGLARKEDEILNVESMRNPNNVKPQLEMEWGMGGPDINLDEPAGVVTRNIPTENIGDAGSVILFARDMMNRGYRGRQVSAALKKRFPPALLASASKGLRGMFALEGLVGRVMVDARGYKNCQAAMKAVANSPFKRFVKYVYGCSCGEPHLLPANETGFIDPVEQTSGNAFDDFLAGEKTTSKMAAHCRSTMMPIMASQGDLDKSFLDNTMIELMNLTPVPQSVVKKVWAMKVSNLARARAAFRWLDRQVDAAEDAKYAGKTNAGEFHIAQADNEISFSDAPQADMMVDGTNPSLMTDIEDPGDAPATNFAGPTALPGILDDVDVIGQADGQIPVELMDEENPAELTLKDEEVVPGQIDLDERAGEIRVDLFESLDAPEVDIEDQIKDPEFEGTDEITFDDLTRAPDELDVAMSQSQDEQEEQDIEL